MGEQTWSFIDKSIWGDGPWSNEVDKASWIDEATGLPCLAVRGHLGNWCGYVGVAEGHPLFGVGRNACPQQCGAAWCAHTPESLLDVHGGITYSDYCQEDNQPHGICHIPEPGQPTHVYWFGFDCVHGGDLEPSMMKFIRSFRRGSTYRDLAYVQAECRRLAAQLAALRPA